MVEEAQEQPKKEKPKITRKMLLAQIARAEGTINENLGIIKYCNALLEGALLPEE
jgi:hypothetical protein